MKKTILLALILMMGVVLQPNLFADTPAGTNAPPSPGKTLTGSIKVNVDDDNDTDSDSEPGSVKGKHHASLAAEVIDMIESIFALSIPFSIVFIFLYFRSRRRQETMILVREFLDKGLAVPAPLLDAIAGANGERSYRLDDGQLNPDVRRGMRYIFLGIGIMLAFYIVNLCENCWAWGLIPTLYGFGYLLVGLLTQRQQARFRSNSPPFAS
jgi:hypothetical protein